MLVFGGLGWESSSYDTRCLYLEGWVGRVVLMTLDACICILFSSAEMH